MSDGYTLTRIATSPNWYIQWIENGRSQRISTRTRDREEADRLRAAFAVEKAIPPPADAAVDSLLDFYLEGKGPDLADKARQALCADHLKRFFGATLAGAAGPAAQDRYVAHRRRAGVTDETIRRELSVLSAAFHYNFRRERIERVPPMVTLAKSPPKERYLTRDEVALILRHFRTGYLPPDRLAAYAAERAQLQAARKNRRRKPAPYISARLPHLALFVRIALYTAARSGVILTLTWDRVDFKRRLIHFPVPGQMRTNKRAAVVPMSAALAGALARAKRRAKAKPTDPVIQWRGESVERIARAFGRHMDWLGFDDVTPHTLRHTAATWAAQKGVSLFLVGGMLGQSVVSTTERYAKHNPEALRTATEAVRRK